MERYGYLSLMIAFLRGKVLKRLPTTVVVDCHGVGYEVRISLHTGSAIEGKEEVALHIHHHFSQDSQALYGFSEDSERQLFVLLVSVSGVGPNTAQLILSYMTPAQTEAAILGEDLAAFRKVKGVGEKTAKRILVDLKDKVIKGAGEPSVALAASDNRTEDEALSALLALGFARAQAQKALSRIRQSGAGSLTVEALIRQALRELS